MSARATSRLLGFLLPGMLAGSVFCQAGCHDWGGLGNGVRLLGIRSEPSPPQNTTTFSVAMPGEVEPGALLLLAVEHSFKAATIVPESFHELATHTEFDGTPTQLAVFARRATADEPASIEYTTTSISYCSAVVLAFANVGQDPEVLAVERALPRLVAGELVIPRPITTDGAGSHAIFIGSFGTKSGSWSAAAPLVERVDLGALAAFDAPIRATASQTDFTISGSSPTPEVAVALVVTLPTLP